MKSLGVLFAAILLCGSVATFFVLLSDSISSVNDWKWQDKHKSNHTHVHQNHSVVDTHLRTNHTLGASVDNAI